MSILTRTRVIDIQRRVKKKPKHARGQLIAGIFLLTLVAIAIIYSFTLGDRVYAQELHDRLLPPGSSGHLLGTDSLGRDVAARIFYGLRTSMFIAFAVVIIGSTVGVLIGLLSGYVGGVVDAVFMRIADAVLSIPTILFALAVIAVIGGGVMNLIGVIAFAQWLTFARNTRGETMLLREMLYSTAAKSLGAKGWWIAVRHVLPHTIPSTIVLMTLGLCQAILTEAGLSFLGVGIQPPEPSLGGMLNEGRQFITAAPWLAIFPGLAIFIAVFGINMLGEGIRGRLAARSTR